MPMSYFAVSHCSEEKEKRVTDPVTIRRLRLQYEVASLLMYTKSVDKGLAKVLKKIACSENWDLGIVWLLNEGDWDCAYAWHRPGLVAAALLLDNQGAFFQGLPLAQDEARARLLTRFDDLSVQPHTSRIADALGVELASAVSVPLDCGGTFYGVIELIRTSAETESDSAELLTLLGCEVGQYLQARHIEAESNDDPLVAAAVEHAGEGLILLSDNGRIISVNPAFTRITGYEEEEACGMALEELLHRPTNRHDDHFFRRIAGDLIIQGHWKGRAWARRKGGSDFPAYLTLNAIHDSKAHITNYVAVFSDFSKQREYEASLEQRALHDGLTGLANRTLLTQRADQAILQAKRHGRPLAILFADLDRFKEVNDLYGHSVGDELLKWVAQRMVDCVRAGDTIARLGGDEFVVLLPELKDPDDALLVGKKIAQSLEESFVFGSRSLSISATVGTAQYPMNGHDMSALLRYADEDLYCRKPVRLR